MIRFTRISQVGVQKKRRHCHCLPILRRDREPSELKAVNYRWPLCWPMISMNRLGLCFRDSKLDRRFHGLSGGCREFWGCMTLEIPENARFLEWKRVRNHDFMRIFKVFLKNTRFA